MRLLHIHHPYLQRNSPILQTCRTRTIYSTISLAQIYRPIYLHHQCCKMTAQISIHLGTMSHQKTTRPQHTSSPKPTTKTSSRAQTAGPPKPIWNSNTTSGSSSASAALIRRCQPTTSQPTTAPSSRRNRCAQSKTSPSRPQAP